LSAPGKIGAGRKERVVMKNTTKIIGFTAFMAVIVLCIAALSMVGCDTGSSPKIEEPGPVEPGPGPSPGPGPIIIGGGGGGGGAKAGSVTYTGTDIDQYGKKTSYKLVITQNTGRYVAQVNDTYALTIGKTTTKGAINHIDTWGGAYGYYTFYLKPSKATDPVIEVTVAGNTILTYDGLTLVSNIGYDVVQVDGADGTADTTAINFTFFAPISGLKAADITFGEDDAGEVVKGALSGSDENWTLEIEVTTPGWITITIDKEDIDDTPSPLFVYKDGEVARELIGLYTYYYGSEVEEGADIEGLKTNLVVYAILDTDDWEYVDASDYDLYDYGSLSTVGTATIWVEYTFEGVTKYDSFTVEVVAVPVDPNLYVTFDPNWDSLVGVEGTGEPPEPKQVAMSGLSISIPGKNTLDKEGYTFDGWTEEQDNSEPFTGIVYKSTDPFFRTYLVEDNTTLYAKWDIHEWDVTFVPNGGTGAPASPVAYDYWDLISKPTMTYTGYTLDGLVSGWYLEATFDTEWDFDNDPLPDNDITLYAKWTANTVSITVTNPTLDADPLADDAVIKIISSNANYGPDNDDYEVTLAELITLGIPADENFTVQLYYSGGGIYTGTSWKVTGTNVTDTGDSIVLYGTDVSTGYGQGSHFLVLTTTLVENGIEYQRVIPFKVN